MHDYKKVEGGGCTGLRPQVKSLRCSQGEVPRPSLEPCTSSRISRSTFIQEAPLPEASGPKAKHLHEQRESRPQPAILACTVGCSLRFASTCWPRMHCLSSWHRRTACKSTLSLTSGAGSLFGAVSDCRLLHPAASVLQHLSSVSCGAGRKKSLEARAADLGPMGDHDAAARSSTTLPSRFGQGQAQAAGHLPPGRLPSSALLAQVARCRLRPHPSPFPCTEHCTAVRHVQGRMHLLALRLGSLAPMKLPSSEPPHVRGSCLRCSRSHLRPAPPALRADRVFALLAVNGHWSYNESLDLTTKPFAESRSFVMALNRPVLAPLASWFPTCFQCSGPLGSSSDPCLQWAGPLGSGPDPTRVLVSNAGTPFEFYILH